MGGSAGIIDERRGGTLLQLHSFFFPLFFFSPYCAFFVFVVQGFEEEKGRMLVWCVVRRVDEKHGFPSAVWLVRLLFFNIQYIY